jgi:hypothetical protein
MSEIETLRISLARIAQALGVAGDMQDMNYSCLAARAKNSRGWNALAETCVEEVQRREAVKKPALDTHAIMRDLADLLAAGNRRSRP